MGVVHEFVTRRVEELKPWPHGMVEEQVIVEVCERFGPPYGGNTDMLRAWIRKAQGRRLSWRGIND